MANVKIKNKLPQLKKKVDNSLLATVDDAARLTRSIARNSIKKRTKKFKGAAPVGESPRTRFGALKNSILYFVHKTKQWAIIGASFGRMGPSAGAHELGGKFRGRIYPKRPFMRPAFEKIIKRLPRLWRYKL